MHTERQFAYWQRVFGACIGACIGAALLLVPPVECLASSGRGPRGIGTNKETTTFVAPDGLVFPVPDGTIEPSEWNEAAVYDLTFSDGTRVDLYLKVVALMDDAGNLEGTCTPFPQNPAYTRACGYYLALAASSNLMGDLIVYLEEGSNTQYGSGSSDGVLTTGQEDMKETYNDTLESPYCYDWTGVADNCPEPQCAPWQGGNCWKCAHDISASCGSYCYQAEATSVKAAPIRGPVQETLDGYWNSTYWMIDWDDLDFKDEFLTMVNEEQTQLELILPFIGNDGATTGDLSDATFSWGDTLRVKFAITTTFSYTYYPVDGDSEDPTNYATLEIGGEAPEPDTGCGSSRYGLLSGILPALVFARPRRRRKG